MQIRLPEFPVEGGCVCAAARYRLAAAPLAIYACHCRDCQRFSGAAYSMSMPVARAHVTLLAGRLEIFEKTGDSGRAVGVHFCPRCATRLWHAPARTPDYWNLKPGTLDDASWVVPVAHVWLGSKLPSTPVPEDVLCFDGQPGANSGVLEAFQKALGD